MSERLDTLIFNSVNVGAISFTFIEVEQILTILVLLSALAYNIKKMNTDES